MRLRANRRQFLKISLGAGLGTVVLPKTISAGSPNGRIQHASIGVGGMGWGDIQQIGSHPNVEIAAICDVDTSRMAAAAKKFPNARRYQDWRELLDKEGDKIDSVNVSTPDHMHAPITMTAINKGKNVYCQKPLTHDVHEARRIAQAAARAGVVTQMGIQVNASIGYRMAVKMIRDGVIGKVKRVYAWSNKPAGNYRPTGPRPSGKDEISATLDWDAWLGTAPVRPYKHGVYHPTWWRGWQDFGVGWLGDMGCHILDTPYLALKLGAPVSVRAEVEPAWRDTPSRRTETWPTWQIVHYTFGGNELTAGKTLELTWSDGYKYPPDHIRRHIDDHKFPTQGALLLGEAGTLLLPHGGGPQLFPAKKFRGYQRPKLAARNHYHHWVDACRGRAKTVAGFDYAGALTEVVLLGTVALRCPGRELAWGAKRMKITNFAAADQYLRRRYRGGWTVEGL
ncbi:MAG: Gfo/Idh/MocA family protein [Planctomycetota bacterium]|jgi:predicted dehydrogenase